MFNNLFMKYFWGTLAIALGVAMIIKTEFFVQNFGSIAWAEQHLGSDGGSRLLYKLIGIAIIFIALLGMTNWLGPLILKGVGGLFGL
jgi:hypothetical protein